MLSSFNKKAMNLNCLIKIDNIEGKSKSFFDEENLGKLKANNNNSEFFLYDYGINPKHLKPF